MAPSPLPAATAWMIRLRSTLVPVGVGVTALLVTVAIGRLRMPAGPAAVRAGAPVVRRAPTVVIGAPAVPPVPAVPAPEPLETSLPPSPPAAEPLEASLAPAPPLPLKGAAQATAAWPGRRLRARPRPPRPIDSGNPYAR